RSAGAQAPARGGPHRRRHAAEGARDRGRHPRRSTPRARGVVPLAGGDPRRGVHQRGHRHADRRRHQRAQRGGAARVMTRLWDKGAPLDERVLHYTAGEDYALDERLVRHDVRASIAHAEMLHAQGLLTHRDFTAIRDGLSALADEHARGAWRIELADEDGQSALERRLTERIGAAGARIHLGRSRNDRVLTAIRLYLREAVGALGAGALAVAYALDELAVREPGTALPGYTHQQQAMPSSVPLWAGGFAAELRDDAAGLSQVLRRIDKSPL